MISAILLSGGTGKRMGRSTPKQYLSLKGKPLILHSLEALLTFPSWNEVIIVCEENCKSLFLPYQDKVMLRFALPGKERHLSVFSGFEMLSLQTELVCIHDGARPLLKAADLLAVIEAGKKEGAAALATPATSTFKEVDKENFIQRTIPRNSLWEVQTPQVLKYELLKAGLKKAISDKLIPTDDLQMVEYLNHRAKLVPGSSSNKKINYPEDLAVAETLMGKNDLQL